MKWWRCELLGDLSLAALDEDPVSSWGQHKAIPDLLSQSLLALEAPDSSCATVTLVL